MESFFRTMLMPVQGKRLRNEIDGFTVSTLNSPDEGWETGLKDSNGVYIVQRYTNRRKAMNGHMKWIRFIARGKRKILDVDIEEVILIKKSKV
jgi:hypothetical protein